MNNILFFVKQFLKTVFFILLLFSCEIEKVIDYSVDFSDEGTICVIGFVSGEGTAQVFITAIQHPYERNDSVQINIDSVFLYGDNDVAVQLFKDTSDLWVKKNIDVSIGNSYWMSVWSNGANIYSDADEMPAKTEIDSVSFVAKGDQAYGMFHFNTKPKVFYNYTVKDSSKYSSYDDDLPTTNIAILDELDYQPSMSVDFPNSYNLNQEKKIMLVLNSLSKVYYQYVSSLDEYGFTYADMYYEPTVVYENINNGRGFFGCFQSDTLKIKISDYVE